MIEMIADIGAFFGMNGSNAQFFIELGHRLVAFGILLGGIVLLLKWGEKGKAEVSTFQEYLKSQNKGKRGGFTLLELLTVIGIVVVLAALILNGMGYAQNKAAASRAAGEISALSNLLEAFKSDFGEYPQPVGSSKTPYSADTPVKGGSGFLGVHLFGDQTLSSIPEVKDPGEEGTDEQKAKYQEYKDNLSSHEAGKSYLQMIRTWAKKNVWPESGISTDADYFQVTPNPGGLKVYARYLIDPFGNPYGYSLGGKYNPTFDLWSTAGVKPAKNEDEDDVEPRWIKNW